MPSIVTPETALSISRKHSFAFSPLHNRFLENQLSPNTPYLATGSYCDCGTTLGSINRTSNTDQDLLNHEAKKLKRKGWSEAKITRWLEQKEKVRQNATDTKLRTSEDELLRWQSCLENFINDGIAERIGLLTHFYNGSLEQESFVIKKQQEVSLASNIANVLISIDSDTLYIFRA